jgi:hypothetical protein
VEVLVELVPRHRALLGVDVVGSARNPGHHLNAIRKTVDEVLDESLRRAGIARSEVLEWEPTGDGALLTLPSEKLGALLDMAQHLDGALDHHNKWRKPEVRMRVAVEVGPVGAEPGFYPAKITHGRLLNAEAFKRLFRRCQESDQGTHTGLIISDQVLRTAFGGDHTNLVRRGEFAPLPVRDKEYADTAWVRVPGFDARSIGELAQPDVRTTPGPQDQPRVSNHVNGNMYGVQTGTVNGGISFGAGPR